MQKDLVKKLRHINPDALICSALALAALAIFWQVRTFDFVNLDDNIYIESNPYVQQGVTPHTFRWAFSRGQFLVDGLWMPLTWLSFMVDNQLHGLNAGGFHMTNVWLHLANTALLFLLLKKMTGARWPSAFMAALFAFHPLHVESVAWVAERKDVLSTLFWILAIWAYVDYTKRPALHRYALTAVLYVGSLMAKPMAITLPVVLLVLDYWPLRRFQQASPLKPKDAPQKEKKLTDKFFDLVIEKILFLAIALGFSKITFFAQQYRGSVKTLDATSVVERLANALLSFTHYIKQMFWPVDLMSGAFSEHPEDLVTKAVIATIILLAVTALAVWRAKKQPYLLAGWLLYVVMLAPVSGIAQTGIQITADRFTYVPLIGIFIMVAWGAKDLVGDGTYRRYAFVGLSAVCLPTLMLLSARQTATWRNSMTLYEHALSIEDRNHVAHVNYAQALLDLGDDELFSQATNHLARALEIDGSRALPHANWGRALMKKGRFTEAVPHLKIFVQKRPDIMDLQLDLALSLFESGEQDAAMRRYEIIGETYPDVPIVHNEWGVAFAKQGHFAEAITHLEKALELDADMVLAYLNLGKTFVDVGRSAHAIPYFKRAVQLEPANAAALNQYAHILATHPSAMTRNGYHALQMAKFAAQLTDHNDAHVLNTLAAAYAELERFEEAMEIAETGLKVAEDHEQQEMVDTLKGALDGYQEKRPLRMETDSIEL